MVDESDKRYLVDSSIMPAFYPTHLHAPEFWEQLGRTIATFGFLEETLSKAIFVFTGTLKYDEYEVDNAFENWLPKLERALSDPLGRLIVTYGEAVRSNPEATVSNLDELIEDMTAASKLRNVLCHGSWRAPDQNGRSLPLFVTRQKQIFDTSIDIRYLQQTQSHVAELCFAIVNTVTHMGWQFPGSTSTGRPLT